MKNRRTGRQENFVADFGPDHVAIWTNNAMIPKPARMVSSGADDRIFEDDAIATDANRPTGFRHNASTMHDPAACTDNNVTAYGSILCNPSVTIDQRRMPRIRDD